jgi:hypothetical protein
LSHAPNPLSISYFTGRVNCFFWAGLDLDCRVYESHLAGMTDMSYPSWSTEDFLIVWVVVAQEWGLLGKIEEEWELASLEVQLRIFFFFSLKFLECQNLQEGKDAGLSTSILLKNIIHVMCCRHVKIIFFYEIIQDRQSFSTHPISKQSILLSVFHIPWFSCRLEA